jgi:hypothetical protein
MNSTLTTAARTGILLGAVALASLGLSGCSAIGAAAARAHSPKPARSNPSNPDGIVTDIKTLSCDTPHDFEDYHQFRLTFASYPGEKSITAKVDDVCGGDALTTFDGVDYGSSTLGLTYLYSTAESWRAGDRAVDCVVAAVAGKSTGSYQGTSK